MCVCHENAYFLYSKDLVVSHVYSYIPYSKEVVVSMVPDTFVVKRFGLFFCVQTKILAQFFATQVYLEYGKCQETWKRPNLLTTKVS